MKKLVKKAADKALGVPMRAGVREWIARPFFERRFDTVIIGTEEALTCTDGAICVSEHPSFVDGPFLMNAAWPYARVWPTAWHEQYYHPLQWPFMWLFSTVPLGSHTRAPRLWRLRMLFSRLAWPWGERVQELWREERARRKARAMDIMNRILRAKRHLLVFAAGGITDASGKTEVRRHLTGVHDLIRDNPEKPVLMVRIRGLEKSRFGRAAVKYKGPDRLPVTVVVRRFDRVSLEGGPEGLNERIENYFNRGIPLTTLQVTSAATSAAA